MIIQPTDPKSISSLITGMTGTAKLDALPTALGHDSSPLAGLPHSAVTSHLLPDKFEAKPVLTRQQRVAAWTQFWNNLTKGVKRDQPFTSMFTVKGSQVDAKASNSTGPLSY
jgi:hypothetical protein